MTDTTETIDNIMKPSINLSASVRLMMVHYRIMTREAVRNAMASMSGMAPRSQDYCGNQEAYDRDMALHLERFDVLGKLYKELGDEALAIQEEAQAKPTKKHRAKKARGQHNDQSR